MTTETATKVQGVETEAGIRKVAIVTYNRIGEGDLPNGVTDGPNVRLFIAQNGHRSKWATNDDDPCQRASTRAMVAKQVARMVDLTDMDHVYVYVGAQGGEEAIRQTHGMPANKITYVMCNCETTLKRRMINSIGNSGAEIIWCECGGRDTLERIARRLLAE